jgi:hypothetical protein
MTDFTSQKARHGREIIRKDDKVVADITPAADGRGLWVHYFGQTSMSGWPHLARNREHARDLITMAARG